MLELREALADFHRVQPFRHRDTPTAFDDVRRRFEDDIAQQIGDDIQMLPIGIERLRIFARELRDFCLRAAGADRQIASVIGEQKFEQLALDDLESVLGELQIANDLRIEVARPCTTQRSCESRDEIPP